LSIICVGEGGELDINPPEGYDKESRPVTACLYCRYFKEDSIQISGATSWHITKMLERKTVAGRKPTQSCAFGKPSHQYDLMVLRITTQGVLGSVVAHVSHDGRGS
jgi:hypothetical protein